MQGHDINNITNGLLRKDLKVGNVYLCRLSNRRVLVTKDEVGEMHFWVFNQQLGKCGEELVNDYQLMVLTVIPKPMGPMGGPPTPSAPQSRGSSPSIPRGTAAPSEAGAAGGDSPLTTHDSQ